MNDTGLELFLEPVTFALDVDGDRVMKNPIQDRRGDDGVAEHFAPTGERLVRRQDHRTLLVPPGDQLEEQVRPMSVDRDVTDLVDDQQLGLAVQFESFLEPILDVGPGQRGDQRLRGE